MSLLNKMSLFPALWRCLFSPKLYKVYGGRNSDGVYEANHLEKWGDQIITSLYIAWHVGLYTSPVLTYLMYRKGYFMLDGVITLTKVAVGVGFLLAASYGLRSFGRINSSVYLEFQKTLMAAKKQLNVENKKALMVYDFDFKFWPVEFRWDEVEGDKSKNRRFETLGRKRFDGNLMYAPCSLASYIVAHTFGIRLIYPGAVSALGYMMSPILLQGRSKMIEKDEAERFKLKASDGNEIDTLFIDKRNKRTDNGTTLVICSEGNASFYEIGIMVTPLKANYSVLGWNHPGFGGSTGMPYPEEEQAAIDVVLQFAIHRLGFKPEQIILFGWSIGGYTTAWAAKSYPDVKAVVIDASFDDLLPLAIPRMPAILEPLVKRTIKHHVNLDISQLLSQYPGPITVIRRTDDEVLCLMPGELSTNRGNHLLVNLLKYRYPNLFDTDSEEALWRWLSASGTQQREIWTVYDVNEERAKEYYDSYCRTYGSTFPCQIGEKMNNKQLKSQLLIYLASKYLVDYASTHCTPLPTSLFNVQDLRNKS